LIDWLGWREGLLALRHIWRNDFHPLRQSPLHEAAILRSLAQALKAEPRCLPECAALSPDRQSRPAARRLTARGRYRPAIRLPWAVLVDPVIK